MTATSAPRWAVPTDPDPDIEAAAGAAPEEPDLAPSWLGALFLLCYVGVAVLVVPLPQNLALVDAVIAVLILVGLANMTKRRSLGKELFSRSLPWLFLIMLGSLVGLMGVGLPWWALSSMVRLTGATLAFFAVLHLLVDSERLVRFAIAGVWCAWGLTVLTVTFLQGAGLRSTGFFANPNYTGHYIILAAAVLLWRTRRRFLKLLIVVLSGYVVYKSGSFGAVAMLLGMGGLYFTRRIGRVGLASLVVVVSVVALGFLLLGSDETEEAEEDVTEDSGFELGNTGFDETRFERSQGARFELWALNLAVLRSHPMGVGPNGAANRTLADDPQDEVTSWAHADVINFVVQRGPIGLVGLIGLWVVIWRSTERYGLARMVFAGIFMASLFRDTVHFRHLWLFMALAMAIDYQKSRRSAPPPNGEPKPLAHPELQDAPYPRSMTPHGQN